MSIRMVHNSNERGGILIISAVSLSVFLLFMAAAIDVTYCYIVKNQLRNIADTAALAGMGAYTRRMSNPEEGEEAESVKIAAVAAAIAAVQNVGLNSSTIDRPDQAVLISPADIQFGVYNYSVTPSQFEPVSGNPENLDSVVQAIRVSARKADGVNARYRFYLRALSRLDDVSLSASATATLVRKNILFLLDTSSSMDDRNYPKATSALLRLKPNEPIENPLDTTGEGFEYYDFKTYPAEAYRGGALGGLPEPINSLLDVLYQFFNETLYNNFDDAFDRAGFVTFNWNVDDRAHRLTGGSLIGRSLLSNLAADCRDSQNFYQQYLDDVVNVKSRFFLSDPSAPVYNPAILNNNENDLVLHDSLLNVGTAYEDRITSIVDYKCAPFGFGVMSDYPNGSAMRELEENPFRYIFPGGTYPSGEDRDRNHYIRTADGDEVSTGYTDIGTALYVAGDIFDEFQQTMHGVPAFNMVILLSDGLPTVYVQSNTKRVDTSGSKYRARDYARNAASALREGGVRICTIFFQSADSLSGADFLRDDIASSEQYHFTESDPNMVQLVLNQLIQSFPYVLVE